MYVPVCKKSVPIRRKRMLATACDTRPVQKTNPQVKPGQREGLIIWSKAEYVR